MDEKTSPLAAHAHDLFMLCVQMILQYHNTKQMPTMRIQDFPPILQENGASFITLTRENRLRGCIGTIEAHRPLCADVAANAIASAFFDRRFNPINIDEMAGLMISISVLTPMTKREFADEQELLSLLRPNIDGLVIADGDKRAVYLPSVWEQIPDKVQFLSHLKEKAGLPAEHWSPNFQAWTYQADKTLPCEFPPLSRSR